MSHQPETHRLTLVSALVLFLLLPGGICAEPGDAVKQAFASFLKAFGNADTEAMGGCYADEVTVKRGSTLLQKGYGGLGGEDGDEKDKVVKLAALLKAYEKAIEMLGGKEDWMERGEELARMEVLYIDHESRDELRPKMTADLLFKAFGAKKGDVLAIVNPKGDLGAFQLREIDGKWKIIADYWD